MDQGGCVSSEVCNTCSDIFLDDVFLSVYHWYYLQVVLWSVANVCYDGVDWYSDEIEDL